MNDPAIEAVKRVWSNRKLVANRPRLHMEAAAREALSPIRERHRPFDRPARYGSTETVRVCAYCMGPKLWPCPDALDAYSSEELGQ